MPTPKTGAKVLVAATPDPAGAFRPPGVDQPPGPPSSAAFRAAVAECLWELQCALDEPGSLGDLSVLDAVQSLAAEFTGEHRDDVILGRLSAVAAMDAAGNLRGAVRHFAHVRRKLARLGITPRPSTPADPAAAADYPAWRSAS